MIRWIPPCRRGVLPAEYTEEVKDEMSHNLTVNIMYSFEEYRDEDKFHLEIDGESWVPITKSLQV